LVVFDDEDVHGAACGRALYGRMPGAVHRLPGLTAAPDDLFAVLRQLGPAAWLDVGRRWRLLARLTAGAPCGAVEWRARSRAALAPGKGLVGGVIGWLGFEAGAWFEQMPDPAAARPLPDAWLGEIAGYALWDRRGGLWCATPDLARLLVGLPPAPSLGPATGRAERVPWDGHRAITRALACIRAGDCYQVNLAQPWRVTGPGSAFDAWRRLHRLNPARRGALVETGVGAVVSNSPELLLRAHGRHLLSVPIKGTQPRSSSRIALARNAKERAELMMIVDLVRNDLGRIATRVDAGPRRVGVVGHLRHAMARVTAELAPGADAVDALAALFPPGSVVGAPKIRALELIRELEPGPRGVYCGAVGCFAPGGRAWWNVAIRTISFADGEARFHVGAGIVMDSEPARELAEMDWKAERLLAALA
jgi:para-aminobenzoate synthetase component 1